MIKYLPQMALIVADAEQQAIKLSYWNWQFYLAASSTFKGLAKKPRAITAGFQSALELRKSFEKIKQIDATSGFNFSGQGI